MEKQNPCFRSRNTAFTLIELMIVVVIIGILAAIAVPSYRSYTVKAKLAEGYVVFDAIKKGEIKYYHENGAFAFGELSENGEPDSTVVMNGEKYAPGSNSPLLALIGPVVPPDQPLGVWIHVLVGGYNETTQVLYDQSEVKIGRSVPAGSQCVNNDDYLGMYPTAFGIPVYGGDDTYDWFLISGVFGLSYPGSENCVYQIQFTETWGEGMKTSPTVELK